MKSSNVFMLMMLAAIALVVDCGGAENGPKSWEESAWDEDSFPFEDESMQCTAGAIRTANTQHLSRILAQLANTTYFRLFRVQLDGKCPLKSKKKKKKKEDALSGEEEQKEEDDDEGCPSAKASGAELHDAGSCTMDTSFNIGNNIPIDKTLSQLEGKVVASAEECDDDELPSFWLDLCANLPFHDSNKEYINLAKNPEIHTGYNGSDIWEAIYKLNQFDEYSSHYEFRFLYRILSGLHSSINLHISEHFYPPLRGKRETWEPNLERFKKHFLGHQERFNNLQFAFVVMLRAARRASSVLSRYQYKTGDLRQDYKTQTLMKLFLDSHVLDSCQDVFEAFDESLLFGGDEKSNRLNAMSQLKRQFKTIFQDISETFNCIGCQKCKLHGKLQLLGVGTAIKILLVPESLIQKSLTREEVVALINTLQKFSESLEIYNRMLLRVVNASTNGNVIPTPTASGPNVSPQVLQEAALAAISDASLRKLIEPQIEDALVDAVLDKTGDIMLLAKHFALNSKQANTFVRHASRRVAQGRIQLLDEESLAPDAIVIGGGLSGLSATISLLDRGGTVVLIDKERIFAGNSAKASSGINGVIEIEGRGENEYGDSVAIFKQDVVKGSERPDFTENPLVDILTSESGNTLDWFRKRIGVDLSEIGQLGGHSKPRTWRPPTGLAGSQMMAALNSRLRELRKTLPESRFKAHTETKAVRIVTDESGNLVGVECQTKDGNKFIVKGKNVIIATGGYGYPFEKGSLLEKVRPDLSDFGTTNGKYATGDGIKLATDVGGDVVDLDQIQIHPTAFVDLKHKNHHIKTLAAELLRGVGAVMLDPKGHRFVNELGTRKFVSEKMLAHQPGVKQPQFLLLLSNKSAALAPKHVPLYVDKGLMFKFDSLDDIAQFMNTNVEIIRSTLAEYDRAVNGEITDPFNRTVFSAPFLKDPPFYGGWITPAIHYSMGGVRINEMAQIVNNANQPILHGHVYAAGETVGGIHGQNRLGGNGLTEAAVFGRHIGTSIEIGTQSTQQQTDGLKPNNDDTQEPNKRKISLQELQHHNKENDCWVAIKGKVYDFTEFAEDHPGGIDSITKLAGTDGTKPFLDVHGEDLLEDFEEIGILMTENENNSSNTENCQGKNCEIDENDDEPETECEEKCGIQKETGVPPGFF